jgi:hypothetical protein
VKVKEFSVKLVERNQIKDFIETYHYSKSINGVMSQYCFGLYYEDRLIGAMLFGALGMANAWKKYTTDSTNLLELRRLCCIDDTPKNTESYFIGKCLKYIKQNTNIKYIISYADSNQNHTGIIYKATNFKYLGMTAKTKIICRLEDGKLFHDKAIRTKYNGKLKPFAQRLKTQLENGEAVYKTQTGKHIFFMVL